ncbi:TMEM164 family-domain-containing protein [Radiomyces spectabilis]|uniref:TMEM164 family-domain-containing protein n=1 Tax=Radiomyces spectabilis TaxID=64574 RepID=UPI00221FA0AE|nr:TMEM164 family-domain-containing protein [Radiomyces spectabilis]KAI8374704.1 TMEM164 family-domain-containing protein [Radiomyces spectabilis]
MPLVSLLNGLWDPVASRLENWIVSFAAKLPVETDWTQSIQGSWYVHPRQHAIEIVFLSSAFVCASAYFLRRALRPGTLNYKLLSNFSPPTPPSLTEKVMVGSLIASLGLTLTHKIMRDSVLFMLQPCHMSALLLILTMTFPDKRSPIPHLFFNIYLHTQWGAIGALVFPDLRDHYLIGETFNFFAEHILILLAPIYMIYSNRYLVLPTSRDLALLSFSIYGFFHSPVLHFFALKSGLNLNYLFTPPPIKLLIQLGPFYRITLYGTALVAMFVTRYGLVNGIMAVLPRKEAPAPKKISAPKKIQ